MQVGNVAGPSLRGNGRKPIRRLVLPRLHHLRLLRLLLPMPRRTTPADETQYVVTTKMVHASPDGDCEETMAPKVTVFAGQTANVSAQDVEAVTGIHGGVGLMIRVMKQDKQVRLNLGVQEHTSINLGDGSKDAVEETRTVCNVTLGKTKRLVFTKHDNGSDASWAEVMVTAIPPEADAEDSPLDCLGEVVDALMDAASDVAMSLFGDDNEVKQAEFTTPAAVAPLPYPVLIAAPCPTCQQCVAVEAVKKSVKQIRIDASHGRKSFEIRDGDKGWKGTADRITLRDGYLVMEGVHTVSSDGEDEITAAKLSVKAADLEIQIGD